MTCGKMYFGAKGRPAKYGMSVADIRASCKAQGLVYDGAGGCRGRKAGGRAKGTVVKHYPLVLRDPMMPVFVPKPKGRAPKYGMPVAVIRANCKNQGLVYDGAGGCRAAKARPGPPKRAPKYGVPLKVLAEQCKAQGLVLDRSTGLCRAAKARKPPPRKPTKYGVPIAQIRARCKEFGLVYDGAGDCRPAKARPGPPKRAPKYGVPLKVLAEQCKAQGLVLDRSTGLCRGAKGRGRAKGTVLKRYPLVLRDPMMPVYVPKPKGRAPKYGMSVAAIRASCKNQGLVYDGAGGCRARAPRTKKAAFGMMHSTPSAWRPGTVYYQASKFNQPSLLLGESFKAVANRAAKEAATTAATSAATKAATTVATKAATTAAVKAADKAVDAAVAASFGRRRRYRY